jgi:hypothetical protein
MLAKHTSREGPWGRLKFEASAEWCPYRGKNRWHVVAHKLKTVLQNELEARVYAILFLYVI